MLNMEPTTSGDRLVQRSRIEVLEDKLERLENLKSSN